MSLRRTVPAGTADEASNFSRPYRDSVTCLSEPGHTVLNAGSGRALPGYFQPRLSNSCPLRSSHWQVSSLLNEGDLFRKRGQEREVKVGGRGILGSLPGSSKTSAFTEVRNAGYR